ncbi:hypothetical protein [Bradyrhizobium sp. AC87j1]|uniref:hypothetical protein n=1 Tax=Bradyrhizobium sp. AC87j1 TaxID=2055894 RepID=UPI001374A96D|nr:hypothetical protein [Bradyrhizobium sp. AC87j1]
MREQLSSGGGHTTRTRSRRFRSVCPSAVLLAGILWFVAAAAVAQTALPGVQPSPGMGATSPLNPASSRPEGIPLGSTEIATPGVSPLNPLQGMTNCAGSGNAGSSGALFDGGGLSGGSSTTCTSGATPPSALPSSSSVGRVGIPLGSTELGGAGISPSVPVPGPTPLGSAGATNGFGNP